MQIKIGAINLYFNRLHPFIIQLTFMASVQG